MEGVAAKSPIAQDLMERFLGVAKPAPRERVIEVPVPAADPTPIAAAIERAAHAVDAEPAKPAV